MGRVSAQWTPIYPRELTQTPHQQEFLQSQGDSDLPAVLDFLEANDSAGGEGFVTTMRSKDGEIHLLEGHVERLARSWQHTGGEDNFPREEFKKLLTWLVPDKGSWALRVARSPGAPWTFEYQELDKNFYPPIPLVIYKETEWRRGYPSFFKTPVSEKIKEFKMWATQQMGEEVELLICNEHGDIIESSIYAVLLADKSKYTIPRHPQALESLSLNELMQKLEREGQEFTIDSYNVGDLAKVGTVWLTNCVRGVRAVKGIYGLSIENGEAHKEKIWFPSGF